MSPPRDSGAIYLDLRAMVLGARPDEIGLAPTPERPRVWGVLMETGYPKGVATLVTLADGTTSLYLSTGGGTIGGGAHEAVASASRRFLAAVERTLDSFVDRLVRAPRRRADDLPCPDVRGRQDARSTGTGPQRRPPPAVTGLPCRARRDQLRRIEEQRD